MAERRIDECKQQSGYESRIVWTGKGVGDKDLP